MKLSNFTFVDVETTGLDPQNDSVIEVGILRVENGKLVKTYKSCVNPKKPVSIEIQRITGIGRVELMLAPTFDKIAPEIAPIFSNSIIVAHNSSFDVEFLENEFRRLNMDFTYPHICTIKLCKELYPFFLRYDLGTVLKKLKVQYGTRHRAYEDASYVWEAFKKIQETTKSTTFQQLLLKVMQKPSKKSIQKSTHAVMELF